MILGYLDILVRSGFGLLFQEKFCPKWDRTLNALLDLHSESALLKAHTLQLGAAEVWTSNYPYSFGDLCRIYKGGRWEEMTEARRPRIRTMVRLRELVLRLKAERDAHDRRQYLKTLEDLTGIAE